MEPYLILQSMSRTQTAVESVMGASHWRMTLCQLPEDTACLLVYLTLHSLRMGERNDRQGDTVHGWAGRTSKTFVKMLYLNVVFYKYFKSQQKVHICDLKTQLLSVKFCIGK